MADYNVWLNNWGSQAAEVIPLIKKKHEPSFRVISTTGVKNPAVMSEADEWYRETCNSKSSWEDYSKFALEICDEHDIDIIMPVRKMLEFSEHRKLFEERGIKLMLPSSHFMMRTLNDKASTYEVLREVVPECIPKYYKVNTVEEFKIAVEALRKEGCGVCFKYVQDIASQSFRIISFEKRGIDEFSSKTKHAIEYDTALEILSSVPKFKDMMVMELLDGLEVSCDCLATSSGNIIIPRMKLNTRIQEVRRQPQLMNLCDRILNFTGYDAPCNIQFKYEIGKTPKLLEINTRMSGGIHISEWATGINIPSIALSQLIGVDEEWNREWKKVQMVAREKYDKM
ncbi:MAG: ATP-grasp domain-containing protein [Clostridia bacterium]|nr:ATP-grasp domain-containing protein [Clostridia bacterium]